MPTWIWIFFIFAGGLFVCCYLYPDVMKRLAKKLESDLRPGTVVISCNFALPGFTPSKVFRPAGSWHNDPLYIYKM